MTYNVFSGTLNLTQSSLVTSILTEVFVHRLLKKADFIALNINDIIKILQLIVYVVYKLACKQRSSSLDH